MTNRANGTRSRDAEIGSSIVEHINKSSSQYPTEVGAPCFDLVDVAKEKDIMLNVARMHAQQEYDRIMEMVSVLQSQAESIQRRLTITDAVHTAEYQFSPSHGGCYWLVKDLDSDSWRLTLTGPEEWTAGAPDAWQWFARIKWLGDYTWTEVDDDGNSVEGGDKWNNNI